MYFPSLVTSLIQPSDQGVIETIKRRYQKEKKNCYCFWKMVKLRISLLLNIMTIKNVICTAAEAWDEIKPSTIVGKKNLVFHQNSALS